MKQTVKREAFLEYAQYNSELLEIEDKLIQCAERNRYNDNYCANNAWYGTFRVKVLALVGWGAKDKRLGTQKAFDTVYEYLYALLPDCKHKSLCWVKNGSEEV